MQLFAVVAPLRPLITLDLLAIRRTSAACLLKLTLRALQVLHPADVSREREHGPVRHAPLLTEPGPFLLAPLFPGRLLRPRGGSRVEIHHPHARCGGYRMEVVGSRRRRLGKWGRKKFGDPRRPGKARNRAAQTRPWAFDNPMRFDDLFTDTFNLTSFFSSSLPRSLQVGEAWLHPSRSPRAES